MGAPILTFAFVLFAAIAPGLAWLFFFLKEDLHPEPKRLIFYTFGMGVIASVPIVLVQLAGQALILGTVASIIVVILFLAFIEEVFKFIAAYLSVNKHPEFDEPVDAMIYMIVAALGLATAENLFVLADIVNTQGVTAFAEIADVAVLRFVGATFLHALTSGLVGYYWARGRLRKTVKKSVAFGIAVATLIHLGFNALILLFQNIDFLVYPSLFLIGASFLLFKDFEKLKAKQ